MANEYYQLDVGFSCGGQFALCVFHYRIANPTDPDDYEVASQLVGALDDGGFPTAWLYRMAGCLSEDAFISSARAKRVAPSGGNEAGVLFSPGDFPGAQAFPIHTQQVAACCIWVADGTPGKSGRNFIPGVPENALDQSRWDATYTGKVDDFIAKHLTGFSVAAGIFLPCIYDRVAKTGWIPDNGYLTPLVGTQRRREVPV